jgi:hypothetical protein
MNAQAISEKTMPTGCMRVFLGVFGLLFVLVGSGVLIGAGLVPLNQAFRAAHWPEAPCVILASQVETHSDSDGTTYAAKIRYRYSLDGAEFVSSRYSFLNIGSGHERAQAVVDRYPVGANSICYYDPQDPGSAVLKREVGWGALFGLMGLPFIAVGAVVVYTSARGFGRSKRAISISSNQPIAEPEFGLSPDEIKAYEGPQKLRSGESRTAKLLMFGMGCLFWNGMLVIFGQHIFRKPGWFELLFLLPFVIAGLGLLGAVVYQALCLFNPRVEVALSNGAVSLGETIDVAWQLEGRVGRLSRLTVSVDGVEQATYTRGSSTVTDKSTFASLVVYDGERKDDFAFGSQAVQIPPGAMHTFRARNNKFVWLVRVRGRIVWWPDIDESFEFVVQPQARS